MLPYRFMSPIWNQKLYPIQLHTIGCTRQSHVSRPNGYMACQILFIREGFGYVQTQECIRRRVEPGDTIVLPPGLPHDYFPEPNSTWIVGFFSFVGEQALHLQQYWGLDQFSVRRPKSTESLHTLLKQLWYALEPGTEINYTHIFELLMKLLLDYNQLTDIQCSPLDTKAEGLHRSDAIANRAASIIRRHYSEPLLLAELARSLGYTPQHFNVIFRKHFGIPPSRYLQLTRLQAACELLSEMHPPTVTETASRVGLDTNYFIRFFHREKGCTPGEYQKRFHVRELSK